MAAPGDDLPASTDREVAGSDVRLKKIVSSAASLTAALSGDHVLDIYCSAPAELQDVVAVRYAGCAAALVEAVGRTPADSWSKDENTQIAAALNEAWTCVSALASIEAGREPPPCDARYVRRTRRPETGDPAALLVAADLADEVATLASLASLSALAPVGVADADAAVACGWAAAAAVRVLASRAPGSAPSADARAASFRARLAIARVIKELRVARSRRNAGEQRGARA